MLTIIPLVPIPIVEAYWLLALAYLFSGRWPSGVPPAWASGRAEPWPSAAAPPAGRARGSRCSAVDAKPAAAAGAGARGRAGAGVHPLDDPEAQAQAA